MKITGLSQSRGKPGPNRHVVCYFDVVIADMILVRGLVLMRDGNTLTVSPLRDPANTSRDFETSTEILDENLNSEIMAAAIAVYRTLGGKDLPHYIK